MNAAHENNWNLIRLMAALQVFYQHAAAWLELPSMRNAPLIGEILFVAIEALPGVAIFFVVSGFLVTQSFLAGPGGVGGFFWRRFLRIYPALWIHYVVIFAALMFGGAWSLSKLGDGATWKWIGGAFLIGSDWWGNIVAGNVSPFDWSSGIYARYPSGVLWTINAELGFYLLAPLVFAPLWRRFGVAWLILLGAGAASLWFALHVKYEVASGAAVGNAIGFLRNQPGPYFWVFLIGGAVALYWERLQFLFEGRALFWAAGYAALTLGDIFLLGNRYANINMVGLDALMLPRIVVLAGFVISFAYSWRGVGASVRKFDLSYAIYLYHMLVVWTLLGLGLKGQIWIWPIALALVLATAAASWFLVEKPMLGLKRLVSRPSVGERSSTQNG
ncbi:MAG: acyltransferase [Parvularculaceae bacterium]